MVQLARGWAWGLIGEGGGTEQEEGERGEREGNDEGKTVFSITSPFRCFTPLIPELI